LAALAAVLPMVWLGSPDGHDFQYHLHSWVDLSEQWRAGVWFPRWASLAAYGFGQASFVFYPPLERTLGALVMILAPANVAYAIYSLLVLFAAGASMFALARRWLGGSQAVVAAAFYAVNPYMLLCVYQRSAVAEMLVGALFPLVLLFADRLPDRRALAGLSLVFAACWLSDLPAAVVVGYLLVLALLLLAWTRRSWSVLVQGGLAIVLGFALAAFFVLPATYQQRWIQIEQAISPDFRPENWEFTWTWDQEAGWFYAIVSCLVYGVSVLAAGSALLAFGRRALPRRVLLLLSVLIAVCILMLTPWSTVLWTHLPKLEFVQFPWRVLFVLSTALAVLLIAGLSPPTKAMVAPTGAVRSARLALTAAILIALVGGLLSGWDASWHRGAVRDAQEEIADHGGYEPDGGFLPAYVNAQWLDANRTAPLVGLARQDGGPVQAVVTVARWTPNRKRFTVDAGEPATATLHLLDYPGWRVTVNGRSTTASHNGVGQLTVPLPAGHNQVEAAFGRTPDRLAGDCISFLGIIVWIFVAVRSPRMPAGDKRN
jgi:hypothetical protein